MSQLRSARQVPAPHLEIERFELSCGAVLLVSPREGAPVCAIHVHLRGARANDPIDRAGTAFLTGGLADQGTRDHTEEELVGMLEPWGGEISGDAMGMAGSIVGPEWKRLGRVMAEILTQPKYPAKQVERQKRRVLDRLLVERDDPRAQGALLFRDLVYGDHWVGRPNHGTLESVQAIEPKHLRAFHHKQWVGRRATISVCGDVDPKAVRRFFERELAEWTRGTPYTPQKSQFPDPGVRVDTFFAEREQVHVYLGHLGIRRSSPDYPALVVMDHILGTGPGFTNRISRKLRDEQGLAYSVNAAIHSSAGLLPGTFTAYIGTSPEHVETAIAGFLNEIHEIQSTPVSAKEIDMAKSYLLGSYALGFERASRRASYLITHEMHGFPDDQLERLPEQFDAVTIDDVQRVAQQYLFPDRCCLAASGPIAKKDLEKVLDRAMSVA